MRKENACAVFAVVAAGIFWTRLAVACPHCNIHNYLDRSVQSSTNIFHGEIVRELDDRTAEVQLLKVLRGKYEVGSKVKVEVHGSKERIGEKYIFSDPTSYPPTFEILPLEFEDEILFLIQEKPAVKNLKEAIKRVQGISTLSQDIGMEYLKNHYEDAVGPLIAELDTLMPAVFSTNDVSFGTHRLGKLLEALFSTGSDRAKEFALSYVGKIVEQNGEKIDWASIPNTASPHGVFLQDMLRHSQEHKEFAVILREKLIAQLPNLSGRTLTDVAYALVLSTPVTADDIGKTLKADDASADMLAVGLYFAGNYNSRWWAHEKAYAFWDKALATAKQGKLQTTISERIKRAEQIHKRKNASKEMGSDKK